MIERKISAAAVLAAALMGAHPASAASPGEAQFMENCAACHQVTGKGIPKAFPALAGNPFVVSDPKKVAQVVLHGRAGMPAFKDDLDDATIAAALTYVRSAWGNKGAPVPKTVVASARTGPPPSPNRPLQAH